MFVRTCVVLCVCVCVVCVHVCKAAMHACQVAGRCLQQGRAITFGIVNVKPVSRRQSLKPSKFVLYTGHHPAKRGVFPLGFTCKHTNSANLIAAAKAGRTLFVSQKSGAYTAGPSVLCVWLISLLR